MPVFSQKTMAQISNGLSSIAKRLLSDMDIRLTPDEWIAAFIKPEHVNVLQQTRELVGNVGQYYSTFSARSTDATKCTIYCAFGNSSPPIIIPKYVEDNGIRTDAPEPIRTKFTAWLDERVRLGVLFGDAQNSIAFLNDHCGNAAAFAAMFPALPTLLKVAENGDEDKLLKRAQKIAAAKTPGAMPKLPLEVKERIAEASDLLLTCSILEKTAAKDSLTKHHAEMRVQGVTLKRKHFIYAATAPDSGIGSHAFV